MIQTKHSHNTKQISEKELWPLCFLQYIYEISDIRNTIYIFLKQKRNNKTAMTSQ